MIRAMKPYGATPNERQLRHFAIGKKAFFHVGMNAYTDREWGDGTEDPALFFPTDADVDSWVRTAKEAGFGLAILVCKHHDGFCIWPTATTEHCIRSSPYRDGKGDLVREFADACRAYGVRMGVYLSLWDRHAPFYGTDAYNDYYEQQLTELLTMYGPIHEVWWDGAGSVDGNLDYARHAATVRRLQPEAALFGAMGAADFVDLRWCGNEAGFVNECHFASIDREVIRVEDNRELNRGSIGAAHYVPAEVDTSIRPGWFYHASQDGLVKSPEALNKLWFSSVGRNAQMLLNFPVDTRGRIGDTDREHALRSHEQISAMLATDYLAGATLSADHAADEQHPIDSAREGADGFFVASACRATVDITLPTPTCCNVLRLGEQVTLGERITSVRLFAVDDEGGERLLFEGRSVGYHYACLFERTTVRRLRLVLEGVAQPTLRHLSLHRFDGSTVDPARDRGANIMSRKEAVAEIAADRKSAVLSFGGIYPFRKVCFRVENMGRVTLSVFDGFKYQMIHESIALSEQAEIFLPEEHDGSYQIRITAERPLCDPPEFYVG